VQARWVWEKRRRPAGGAGARSIKELR